MRSIVNSLLLSRIGRFRASLHAKVALGVMLPLLVVLFSLSLIHYWHERHLLEDQIRLTALQSGEAMRGSLRHVMLVNDQEMLAQVLADWGRTRNVRQAQIIDLDGRVRVDSHDSEVGAIRRRDAPGCGECHQFSAAARPHIVDLSTADGVLRVSAPIVNEADCAGCHAQAGSHLGVLLVDVPLVTPEKDLFNQLRVELLILAGIILVVTLSVYLLIDWLVVRRANAFRRPLARFAAGDFTTRLPASSGLTDELGELANAFNHMADELERYVRQQEKLSELRQRAIVEERERIARELHDGLAQFLGYVNTKAIAVRLLLKSRQMEAANINLLQIEECSRDLFLDMREAILGLKTAGQIGSGLSTTLKDFVSQFQQLNGMPVEVILSPDVENLALTGEIELQLLRIVQEALVNVRKHASANQAWVSLRTNGQALEMMVGDDGRGFDLERVWTNHQPRFGLGIMRERAEAIGAEFDLDSEPGGGTRVTVRLAVKES